MRVKFKAEETQTGRNVVLCFEDDGVPFNPLEIPKPDVTEPMEMRGIGGLGIYLVKQRMDKVCYERTDGKNCLWIEKLDNIPA